MPTITALSSHTFQSAVTAVGNGTALDTSTVTDLIIQISGITSATITFEGSLDGGTNYSPIKAVPIATGTAATTATADGIYRLTIPAYQFQRVRCRVSTYSSGTITVKGLYG